MCTNVYFISQGYCRAFYEQEGEEKTTDFFFEQEFVTNMKSLTTGATSDYVLQACEPIALLSFNRTALLALYKESPQIESLGRIILEQILAKQEEHVSLFKLLNAQERYQHVVAHRPELVRRVPVTQLASYLGITRETLSRIRNKSRQG